MENVKIEYGLLKRANEYELSLCLAANRLCRYPGVQNFFAAVSRLGDGIIWYILMLLLPLAYGQEAVIVSLHMGTVGILGVLVYKWLKPRMLRQRPFAIHQGILMGAAPLDKYSFPSGHTLHAVGFSTVILSYYPEFGWLIIPFAALVALSRVILGLHYPSDVGVGAVLGGVIALTTSAIIT